MFVPSYLSNFSNLLPANTKMMAIGVFVDGHYSATHCNTLQHTATHCNTLQHTATHCNTLLHTATLCNTLQHTAIHCNTLQHTTTHCNTIMAIDIFVDGHSAVSRILGGCPIEPAFEKFCVALCCTVLQCP